MKELTIQKRKDRFMSYNIRPCCATASEWDGWCQAERFYKTPIEGVYFCTDCTPEFAAYNRNHGKCKHTGVVFASDGEGYAPRPRPPK